MLLIETIRNGEKIISTQSYECKTIQELSQTKKERQIEFNRNRLSIILSGRGSDAANLSQEFVVKP